MLSVVTSLPAVGSLHTVVEPSNGWYLPGVSGALREPPIVGLPFGRLNIPGFVRVDPSAGAEHVVEAEIRQVLYTPTTIPEGGDAYETTFSFRTCVGILAADRRSVLRRDGSRDHRHDRGVPAPVTPDGDRARRSNRATGFRGRGPRRRLFALGDGRRRRRRRIDPPRSCSSRVRRYRAEDDGTSRCGTLYQVTADGERGAAFPTTCNSRAPCDVVDSLRRVMFVPDAGGRDPGGVAGRRTAPSGSWSATRLGWCLNPRTWPFASTRNPS